MVLRFFRDGALYAFAGVATQGIAFLLFPFFAHLFHPRDYGTIDLLGVLGSLALLTLTVEVVQGLGRHYVEADKSGRRAYASTAFIFSVVVYSVFAVVVALAASPLTDLLLGDDVDPGLMQLQAAIIWCNGLLYVAQDLFRWRLQPRRFASVAIAVAAITTASSAVYVLALDWGVAGALAGQLTGAAVGLVIALYWSRDAFGLVFEDQRLREMLAYSAPLVPASIGVFFNGFADRLAIQWGMTLADVGVYGVAYRLSLVVALTLIGFQGALMPLVLSRHELAQTRVDVGRIFRLFCAMALGVTLLVSVFADEMLRVLTSSDYYAAADIVPLVVGGAFLAGMYIFAPGLPIAKRTGALATTTILAGALNAVLAFSLVKPLGIAGAAAATLFSSLVGFSLQMWMSQRLWHVRHAWGRIAAATAAIAVLTGAGVALPVATEEPVAALAKLALAALGIGLLMVLLVDGDERAFARDLIRRTRGALAARRSALGVEG